MKKYLRSIFLLILLGFTLHGSAQQEAMFTHYMDNTLNVNPAYAGSKEAMSFNVLHRSQWVDFKGAPQTETLNLHSPLKNKHIGIGATFQNDKIGPIHTLSGQLSFAYKLTLNTKTYLGMGISAGISQMKANLTDLQITESNDVVFQENINNRIQPNFGFGLYLHHERFYAGVSVPKLLENTYSAKEISGNPILFAEQRHYYIEAGAVFHLSQEVELKPTTLIKVTYAAPVEADITATFIFDKRITAGLNYRTGDAIGILVGYYITPQFNIGYSYDWSYGLSTGKYNSGSHEILLSYDFNFGDHKKIYSPRYF